MTFRELAPGDAYRIVGLSAPWSRWVKVSDRRCVPASALERGEPRRRQREDPRQRVVPDGRVAGWEAALGWPLERLDQ